MINAIIIDIKKISNLFLFLLWVIIFVILFLFVIFFFEFFFSLI